MAASEDEQQRRAVVFVLIDGLADVSLRELGGRTTLEAAHTPAMDAIARASRCFLVFSTIALS